MASYSSQQLTVGSLVVSFDPDKLSPHGENIPLNAVFYVEGGSIRFRTAGVPTQVKGYLAPPGTVVTLKRSEHDIEKFKAIATNPAEPAFLYAEFFNDLE